MTDDKSSLEPGSSNDSLPSEPPSSGTSISNPRARPLISILAAVFCGALLICLFVHFTRVEIDWSVTKDFIDAVKNLAEVTAIIIGGIWAYYRFFKERTHEESVDLIVSGSLRSIGGSAYLTAVAHIKNVGLSNVRIRREGSGLRVLIYESETNESEVHTALDHPLATFAVFENDQYIEPKESIQNQRLVAIPEGVKIGLRVELYIQSQEGYTWDTSCIVLWDSKYDKEETKTDVLGR